MKVKGRPGGNWTERVAEVNSALYKSQWALSSQDRAEKGTLSYTQVLLEVSQVMVL